MLNLRENMEKGRNVKLNQKNCAFFGRMCRCWEICVRFCIIWVLKDAPTEFIYNIGGAARIWCFTWVVKDAPNDGGHKLDWDKGKREEYLGPERVDIYFDESVNEWFLQSSKLSIGRDICVKSGNLWWNIWENKQCLRTKPFLERSVQVTDQCRV